MTSVVRHATLLKATTGVEFGGLVDIGAAFPGSVSVHVEGIAGGDEVDILISNEKEHNEPSEVKFGSTITSDGFTEITTPSRWIRAKHLTDGSGTVYCWLSWLEYI